MRPTSARSLVPGLLLALAACSPAAPPATTPPVATTAATAPAGSAAPATTGAAGPVDAKGIDLAGMDRGVAPGDDFFAFANGTWVKSTEIPEDRSTWGSGAMTAERTAKRTSDLIAEAAKGNAPAGSDAKKVGDYYASFMDEAAIETKKLEPIKPMLAAIAKIGDPKALARALGESLRADVDVLNATNLDTDNLFGLWVAQDLDDPTRYAPFLLQGGLELPDRDYYLSSDARMTDIRAKYKAHIAAVLKLAGLADAEKRAARILDLETRIAKVHATREDTEDVKKGNNHWPKADLAKKAPGLDWDAFLAAAQLDKQATFVLWQPQAIIGISALVKSEPLDAWKDLLAFHAMERHAAFLPKAVVEESFAFYGKTINGTPQQRERWKRAVEATDGALGEVVGKLYVEKYFPASEKARAEQMVKNIVAAFGARIDKLEWMSPKTKAQAKAKLAVLEVGVGYPDKWRDYSGLEVVRGDAFGNYVRASKFEYARNLAKLGKPVDRREWVMNAQLVNAVNLPAMNALNFPAAILQPPLFDPARPVAMDYGAAGAVIGHEICHSFDDTGALFDAKGKLQNWWTEEDFAHFKASSAALVAQYDAYQPFPDIHVNGKLTSAENIADVAGLSAAYDAYRLSNGGKEGPTMGGLTGDQQFFVSFAQSWRFKAREAMARKRLLTDVHAPAQYRADTVRNLDAWYPAFDVKPGQKLFLAPPARVHVY
ncbi:MAG: M13 family metallopeptidase [Deltaproteobacteria bacterium]|nr:M13 family metallopeptidase [Deltaproteobacteria bacterium]